MEDLALVATVPVAKGKATFKSGPKKGKLRKGCRFKGKRVYCTPEVATRLGKMVGTKSKKKGKKSKGTHPCASASPPAWCNKKKSDSTQSRASASTRDPAEAAVFANIAQARKDFKAATTCKEKRFTARLLNQLFATAMKFPGEPSKVRARNARYRTEGENKLREGIRFCNAAQEKLRSAQDAAAFRGLRRRH